MTTRKTTETKVDGRPRVCSFCGRLNSQVEVLIESKTANICNECIITCGSIVDKQRKAKSKKEEEIPSPTQLKDILDQYVIGQDRAKRILSVAVYNHFKRIRNPVINEVEIEKSNIIMPGPTGSGKTMIIKTISKILQVPLYVADATQYSITGYVGMDINQMLSGLLAAAHDDITLAQQGIIYIDEIDKIAGAPENPGLTRDVSGTALQQNMLKMIEGTMMEIPANKSMRMHPHQETIPIDTTNILFIVGGAFVGIEKIVKKRMNTRHIGFGAEITTAQEEIDNQNLTKFYREIRTTDLIQFGIIPELVGRLPVIATFDELTREDLHRILTEPKNAVIKQYQQMFKLDNVTMDLSLEALDKIVEEALKRKTGARGLRGIIEQIMLDSNYKIKELGEKITITGEDVNKVLVKG